MVWLLALALALCPVLASAQSPQVRAAVLGYVPPAAAAGLSIPSSNFNCGTATAPTVVLGATPANTIIILHVETNSSAVSTIADTAGLTWSLTPRAQSGSGKLFEYSAKSAGSLAGDTITVTFLGSTFYNLGALAIAGANFASPFDPNGSLPTVLASGVPTVTTTNPNTVIYAIERVNNGATPTPGAGFTAVAGSFSACFAMFQYKIVSFAQPGTSIPLTTGAGQELETITDAVTK
jgi:hypothetical protein